MRLARLAAAAVLVLAALFALHVELNLGGFRHLLRAARDHGTARGELVVGFLPVT